MTIPPELLCRCWFLAGPTAAGKTVIGLRLAQALGAEIVALDSMTLYRRMDIGTAKPTAAEQAAVPHHLLDLLEPWDEFTVAEYLQAARQACEEILARGRTPLFVGGTGLYLRSVLRGVFEGPAADWVFRQQLAEEARRQPPGWLHQQVAAIDPPTARRLAPADERRLIRALEIHHLTATPPSELQRERPLPPEERPRHVYWLSPPRDWLYERINQRVDAMIAAGLVAEVQALLDDPRGLSRTARQALGYKELIAHLEGAGSLELAVSEIKVRTRQFAKRQHTWFRNLVECQELKLTGEETADEVVEGLISREGRVTS